MKIPAQNRATESSQGLKIMKVTFRKQIVKYLKNVYQSLFGHRSIGTGIESLLGFMFYFTKSIIYFLIYLIITILVVTFKLTLKTLNSDYDEP